MNINEININRQLKFLTACDIGEKLLAVDIDGYGIFEIEKASGKSKILVALQRNNQGRLIYQAVEKYKDKVFFFPNNFTLEPVLVFDIKKNKERYINLFLKSKFFVGNYKPIYRVGDTVWLFPDDIHSELVVFDLINEEINIIASWKGAMKEIQINYVNSYRKVGNLLKVNESYYVTIIRTNIIVEISTNSYEIKLHRLSREISLFVSMDYDGENIWILDISNGIIKWNYKRGMEERFQLFEKSELPRFKDILCGKKYIWLIPYMQNKQIAKIDYNTKRMEIVEIFSNEFEYDTENCVDVMFGMIYRKEKVVDLYPMNGNLVIHIDLEKDILLQNHEVITLPEEWTNEDIIKYELNKSRESERMNTNDFFNVFINGNIVERVKEDNYTKGESIWDRLK